MGKIHQLVNVLTGFLTIIRNRVMILINYFTRSRSTIWPQCVVIELTNHCNLACPMCPHHKMTRPKGLMDEVFYKKIIDEISGHVDYVAFHNMGESLIHPKISEFIAYAKSKNLGTYLSTNGVLLTEDKVRSLLDAGLDFMIVDFDGNNAEQYEEIRKGAKYDKVLDNINSLIANSNGNVNVDIQSIVFPGHKKNLHVIFGKESKLKNVHYRYKFFSESFNNTGEIIPHHKPCFFIWFQMVVLWDGRVSLCCHDYDGKLIIGDANKTSLFSIWNGDKVSELRRRHRAVDYQDITLCNACGLPNMPYFNPLTIVGSTLLGGRLVRSLMGRVEKFLALFERTR